jgi:hypothetical protein
MERRRFIEVIAGGLLAAPLAVEAQQAGKVWRIGILAPGVPQDLSRSVFMQTLRELGCVENPSRLEVRDG